MLTRISVPEFKTASKSKRKYN